MPDPRLARPLWRGRTNVDAFTIAWIEHAEAIVRERWPRFAHLFVVTQGGYQGDGGDPDSAGTHARGGGTDFRWCGHLECLLALRLAGGFAWLRTPAQGPWPHHIHGAPLGHPDMADGLARQEIAYRGRRNGLKDNGPDDGPQLNPIPGPVWPWPEEDIVTPEDIEQIARAAGAEATKQILASKVAAEGPTVKAALRMASKAAGMENRIAARVGQLLLNEPGDVAATVTAEQIEAAVKQALREGTDD